MNGMDMISFDYSQPITNMSTFRVEFKYSNFDFEFPDRYYDDVNIMPTNNNTVINNTGTSQTVIPNNAINKDDSQIILDEC